MNNFENELRELINRYSKENDSNTPDFILSNYLMKCLNTWNEITNEREKYYGRKEKSGCSIEVERNRLWPNVSDL